YDGAKLAQGRDRAIRTVEDNPELADELEVKIAEALKEQSASAMGPRKAAPAPKPVESKDADEVIDDEELDIDDDFTDDDEADLFSVSED
ncbi:MAG: hypothetical protein K2L63_06790, partial [Paramuribaculum sp.]|nr:hypothetical protein [Paramuribaculum sp.]